MSQPQPESSFSQYLAFAKSAALIVCAVALVWSARPALFEPPVLDQSGLVERRLRSLWFGMTMYYVDYGAYPQAAAPDGGAPLALTTPIAYVLDLHRDPYSTPDTAFRPRSEPAARGALVRVSAMFIVFFAARFLFILFWPDRWRLERFRGGVDLWAAGIALAVWVLASYRLSPAALGTALLGALVAGAFGLFGLRRLTQGALLLVGLCGCGLVFSLLTKREVLLWFAAACIVLAVLRTCLFYWTLTVRRSKDAAGFFDRPVFGRAFLHPLCVYVVFISCVALLVLTNAQLREDAQMRSLRRGAEPFACATRPDFFAVSSNGPDFKSDWRDDVLYRLLDEEGPQAGADYLTQRTYDPTNGLRSRGDIFRFGTKARRGETQPNIDN